MPVSSQTDITQFIEKSGLSRKEIVLIEKQVELVPEFVSGKERKLAASA